MIPIQKMFIALMDIFQKIQGVMTAGLYTMLGSYYTLQSLMGSILELFVKMLISFTVYGICCEIFIILDILLHRFRNLRIRCAM